jgi:hypothetical protein
MYFAFAGALPRTEPNPAQLEHTADGAHGGCSMGREFVAELNRLGHDAECWNYWHTTEDGVPIHEAYDGVFFFDNNMYELWKKVVPRWDWANKLSIGWMHLVNLAATQSLEIYRNCKIVATTSQPLLDELQELTCGEERKAVDPFILQWAVTTKDFPPALPSPYAPHTKNVIWCGRIGERAAQLLRALGPQIKQRLNAKLTIITSTENAFGNELPIDTDVLGPFKHGTFEHYLYYADVAIDSSLGPAQHVINCKQYDYLGAGLPIVCEPVPAYELMRAQCHGIVLLFHPDNQHEYLVALSQALHTKWANEDVRKWMQENHTWTHRARQVNEKIQTLAGPWG